MKKLVFITSVSLFLLAGIALGGINSEEPASMLIFPYFSTYPGEETLIFITNINVCNIYNPDTEGFYGDVYLHFHYADAEEDCEIVDRKVFLTPGDSLCVLAKQHYPRKRKGWLYVIARHPKDWDPVKVDGIFEYDGVNQYKSGLIGSTMVISGSQNYRWAIPAIGIKASENLDFWDPIDINENNVLDFGPEYEGLPKYLYISDFIEQGFAGAEDLLVLLTFQFPKVEVTLKYLFWHNDEIEFSQMEAFSCWMMRPLVDIWHGADDLSILGADVTPLPTGWASLQVERGFDEGSGDEIPATEIPLFGMVISNILSGYSSAQLLHHTPEPEIGGSVKFF